MYVYTEASKWFLVYKWLLMYRMRQTSDCWCTEWGKQVIVDVQNEANKWGKQVIVVVQNEANKWLLTYFPIFQTWWSRPRQRGDCWCTDQGKQAIFNLWTEANKWLFMYWLRQTSNCWCIEQAHKWLLMYFPHLPDLVKKTEVNKQLLMYRSRRTSDYWCTFPISQTWWRRLR